jgi:hypothetical protein
MAADRSPRAIRALAAGAAVIVSLLPGVAHGAGPSPCAAGPNTTRFVATTRLGVVDLHLFDAHGAPATFFECVGDRAVELGRRTAPADEVTRLWAATAWRCGRLTRRFAGTATLADGTIAHGTHTIRTRSCAQRFDLVVPRRLAPGAHARIRVSDRWHIGGVRASLCIARPGRRPACRQLVFLPGRALALRTFRVAARGRWRVEVRVQGHRTRATIAVGVRAGAPRKALPTLLATGDSTMDLLGNFLSDQLADEENVVSQVEPGLAISKSNAFQPIAVKQVARLDPATTVVSIGADEGWSMPAADGASHECCDAAWVDEYVRRVRTTMLTYGRRVFWLTIVAPKNPLRAPIVAAVNTAIVRAAEGLPEVHVVRMDLLFSPDGYRDVIRYRGRDVRVREPDGVHLNIAGAEIAAREVVKALHAVSDG